MRILKRIAESQRISMVLVVIVCLSAGGTITVALAWLIARILK